MSPAHEWIDRYPANMQKLKDAWVRVKQLARVTGEAYKGCVLLLQEVGSFKHCELKAGLLPSTEAKDK